MSDEERERQIEFIINTVARLSAKVDALVDAQKQATQERLDFEQKHRVSEKERKADAVRLARVEEAYVSMMRLVERHEERLDNHETRVADIEGAIVILTRLLEKNSNGSSSSSP